MLTEGSRRSREAIDAAYAEQRGGAPKAGVGRGQLIFQVVFGVLWLALGLFWVIDGGDGDRLSQVTFGLLGLAWTIRGAVSAWKLFRLRKASDD